ncbi:STAS domain-containing protein [Haloglycomyces albus]|uniref:STAS domain-containing protein n=1 Tax=Haloglycomyces albus TaxID=526067 RepID=UPI00046D514C|nr:STAS domain-containing protein [Haloglycomyces albus]
MDTNSEPELGLSLSTSGSYAVVAVNGEIDMYTAPQLRDAVNDTVTKGYTNIAVDLSGVDFCDSTGLGVLVGARRNLTRRGGHLVVVAANSRIEKLLQLTGLNVVLDVRETVPESE